MKKGKIMIDSDGFFLHDSINAGYMQKERKSISFEREGQSFRNLFEQYYLGFRSAMFICEDSIENQHEAMEVLRIYRENCLNSALCYMRNHMKAEQDLPVDFMWITRQNIVDELKNNYPKVEEINLRLSMKPRISARAVDVNTIVFPALARTVFNHCNLVIINSALRVIGDDGHLIEDIDRIEISRLLLPYMLFCHADFSVKNLPMISAHSKNAILTALSYTNLQTMFIFAHEYAHILLQHFNNNANVPNLNEMIENDADSFALKVILNYTKKIDLYSESDVFTAIRWLFKYQLIEESIGVLIQGGTLDIYKSTYENRRSKFQEELINSQNLRSTTKLDMIGFTAIVKLQDVLYEYGSDIINEIINAFEESNKTGGIKPWWKIITKK